MAEAAEPTGESKDTEAKIQQPTLETVGAQDRRGPRSVLKVSQLLLRAIASHKVLTLATLKKELGNAGYEVRRKRSRHSGEASGAGTRGTLLRVSGSDASGYFSVFKVPKPKRKPGRPRLQEGVRSPRRSPARLRGPQRCRVQRPEAKKARQVRRRPRVSSPASRRVRRVQKVPPRARSKAGVRRGRPVRDNSRPRTRDSKRTSTKPREAKERDQERPVKLTTQKSAPVQSDPPSSQQRNNPDPRAVRESPGNAAETP